MAAHAHLPPPSHSADSIFGEPEGWRISDASKVASFGTLCLSADSTRCQLSESLSDFKIRRDVRPDFTLPSGALYFRHYEVGRAPRPWICMEPGKLSNPDVSRLFALILVAILQCSNPLFRRCHSLRPFDLGDLALSRLAAVAPSRPIYDTFARASTFVSSLAVSPGLLCSAASLSRPTLASNPVCRLVSVHYVPVAVELLQHRYDLFGGKLWLDSLP
eukprot:scaffold5852_cov100-Phaeocystis_antarctica.AAC.3